MQNNPTNIDIEDRLRAYAARRRTEAGGNFRLPSHTRQLLQSEIRRRFTSERRAVSLSLLHRISESLRFKPTLSIAAALLVVCFLGLGVRMAWRARESATVAKIESGHGGATPVLSVTDREAPAAVQPSGIPEISQIPSRASLAANNKQVTIGAAPSSGQELRSTPAISQRFQQTSAPKSVQQTAQSIAKTILATFTIELAKGKLRLVDSDGSVYEAKLISDDSAMSLPGGALSQARYNTQQDPAVRAAGQSRTRLVDQMQTGPFDTRARMQTEKGLSPHLVTPTGSVSQSSIWFLAIGTNRTLNQTVSVRGQLIPSQELAEEIRPTDAWTDLDAVVIQKLLEKATVQGHVVVGMTNEFEFNATPR